MRMRSFAFMIAYYGASAVYQGYVALYYGSIGLNRAQIGAVNAAAAISALITQPVWGILGDRVKRRTRLLCLLSAAAALLLPAYLIGKGFWLQIAAAFAFYAFFSALLPLGDAVVLSSENDMYGKIRLSGGLSYAIFSLLGGWLTGKMDVKYALWAVTALLALAALSALLLRDGKREAKGKKGIFCALKDQNLRALLLFMLPCQLAMGVYYGFFALYFMELPGASRFLLGAGNLIAALAEIPYLLFSDRLFEKFGAGKTMIFASAAMCLRFGLLGAFKNRWTALLSQLLNGCGYIAVGVSMAKHMAKVLPRENAAGGQALISMMFYGAARLLGSLLGGFIAEKTGIGAVFLMVSGLCGLGTVLFIIYTVRRRIRV